ncbi:MAG TPA: hypothetical protein PKW25_08365 [Syntrophomonadaceae bacterium]|nr:hypothetical protein [Syntrophomonadaceae bacterium]
MRRISFWHASQPLHDGFYNACMDLTPLVEPSGISSVYLDLTGSKIKKSQIKQLASHADGPLRIGMAASRLAAHIAAVADCLPPANRDKDYRIHSWSDRELVEILPHREVSFLAALPLECLYPLERSQVKRLRRTGFDRIGDVAALPPYELVRLLGEEGLLISNLARGIDNTPVMGLYPPHRILYQLNFESELDNEVSLRGIFYQAADQLSAQLRRKNSVCQRISLELQRDTHKAQAQRLLQAGSQDSQFLHHVLEGLSKNIMTQYAAEYRITGLTIILDQLAPLSWSQPDLFSCRRISSAEEKPRLDQALTRLENRFPGFLTRGIAIARREQVLALWDPWRLTPHE